MVSLWPLYHTGLTGGVLGLCAEMHLKCGTLHRRVYAFPNHVHSNNFFFYCNFLFSWLQPLKLSTEIKCLLILTSPQTTHIAWSNLVDLVQACLIIDLLSLLIGSSSLSCSSCSYILSCSLSHISVWYISLGCRMHKQFILWALGSLFSIDFVTSRFLIAPVSPKSLKLWSGFCTAWINSAISLGWWFLTGGVICNSSTVSIAIAVWLPWLFSWTQKMSSAVF